MEILLYNAILLLLEAFLLGVMGSTGLKSNKANLAIFMTLAFIQLFVLHAFLDPSTMPDLPAYVWFYEELESMSPFEPIISPFTGAPARNEIGWCIMNKALCMIWNNPRLLLIVTSLGIVGGYFVAIMKYSPRIGLSVLMFYFTTYLQSLFVLRQHLAVALCLLAIPAILKRNQVQFLLIVFLAISMHKTAVLYIPVYYLYKMEVNRNFWHIFIAALVIGTPLMSVVANWIYANTWYDAYAEGVISNAVPLAIQTLVMFTYFYCSRWRVNGVAKEEKLFFVMGVLGWLFGIWGMLYSGFSSRLPMYYTVSNIFLLPIAINKTIDPVQRLVITALTIVCFFASFYVTIGRLVDKYHMIFLQ